MKSKILYHYCSFDTFLKIIENKTLQFSEITKSNDSEEIRFLWRHYLSYIKEHNDNSVSSKVLENEINNQLDMTEFYVISFTTKKDDLHMWNCYAKGGVSIGFDRNKLQSWVKHIEVFDNSIAYVDNGDCDHAQLEEVAYYSKKAVNDLIENQCFGIDFVFEPFFEVFKKAPFSKTDFWKAEREWRISIPLIYQDKLNYSELPKYVRIPKKAEMKIGPKGNFPICVRYFVPFDPKMIVSVTLAPDCNVQIADFKKMLYLYDFGHLNEKEQVFTSNGSLR